MSRPEITHPDSEILTDFVAGQLDRTMRVLIETHLDFCATCSQTVSELSRPGSLWLAAAAAVPLPTAGWPRLSQRLDSLDEADSGHLPSAALAELEVCETPTELASERRAQPGRSLGWLRLPFTHGQVAILERAKEDPAVGRPDDVALLLGRAGPGQLFPRHRHLGLEQVVVVEGGYRDSYGHWAAGSWAEYPAGSEHAPLADTDGPCVVLARLSKGTRFSGLCGLALALRDTVSWLGRGLSRP